MKPSNLATTNRPRLAPLGAVGSVLWMGGPGLLMFVLMRFGIPLATEAGLSQLLAFWGAIYIPCLVAGLLSLICYARDGYAWTWAAFSERMRLGGLSRKVWGAVVIGTVLVIVLENAVLDKTPMLLAEIGLFALRLLASS